MPMTACEGALRQWHRTAGDVIDTSFNAAHAPLIRSYGLLNDIGAWITAVTPRRESVILAAARREYEFALYSATVGHYGHAFGSLRLFLELALACVSYSAHRLLLNEWLDGRCDVNWGSLASADDGVLSDRFIRGFFPGLAEHAPVHRSMAMKLYRECSEFVHGNTTALGSIPSTVSFSAPACELWNTKADTAGLVVTFALFARYALSLPAHSLPLIEHATLDRVGHFEAVRVIFGGVAGGV